MPNTSVARIICFLLFLVLKFEITFSDDVPIIGPADVSLLNVMQCENYEKLPSSVILDKKKFNRTVELLNGVITLDMDLDESVAMYINLAKWGDGGYKPNFIMINHTNACRLFFQYFNKSVKEVLSAAGRTPSCPIKKGTILVNDYVFDSRDLPDGMMYGKFRNTVTFVKNGEVVLCYVWTFEAKMKNMIG